MSLEQLTTEELSELRGDLERKLGQADAEIARRGGGEPVVDAMRVRFEVGVAEDEAFCLEGGVSNRG